jgi:hypothetical protein
MTDNSQSGQQDMTNAALLFSKALSLILDNEQGIIVDVNIPGVNLNDDATKVVIYRLGEAIHVQRIDQDIEQGMVVQLNLTDEENNTDTE